MAQRRRSRALGLTCLLFTLAGRLPAQQPLKLGGEFQVNAYTNAYQGFPAVGRANNGDFVVTWVSIGQDGSGNGAFAQRFDSAGVRRGAEFQVNTRTSSNQGLPDVAAEDNGDFVVVFPSYEQDGDVIGVFARRFTASGAPLGAEFQVNTRTQGAQYNATIAADADGDFVVVWTGQQQDGSYGGIFGRRFAANGSAQATEFQINLQTLGNQYHSDVAVDADGDFVVVWESFGQDGQGYAVIARRFTSSGGSGLEILVNDHTQGDQSGPIVAVDADGDFVVAWRSGHDGDSAGAFAKRFSSSGTPRGVEFQVNLYTTGLQSFPFVDLDAAGNFVVTWFSQNQDGGGYGAFARYFAASGAAVGGEFQVNSFTPGTQCCADVGMDGNGDFVLVWQSRGQDGFQDGVFAQRFARPKVLDIDGNGSIGPLTDGLLVLRYMFGFTSTTLTAGAVGNGCTRCNAAAIEPYLQGLV